MSTQSVWFAAFVASLCVFACAVAFQVSSTLYWTPPAGGLPYGLKNAVLAMELAKEPWPVDMLAPQGNNEEMTRQQYIDYFFIPSYTALFLLVAILQSHSATRWVAALGPVCIALILIAATYDLVENRAILGVTVHHDPNAWPDIRPASMVKWTIVFLVVLLQASFYFTVDKVRVLARVMGSASILAGLAGLASSLSGNEKGIEIASLPFLVSMLAMPVFLYLGGRAAQSSSERL